MMFDTVCVPVKSYYHLAFYRSQTKY